MGHNWPALGLSSHFDSYGLLLPTLAMLGFGFDRDWGWDLFVGKNMGKAAHALFWRAGINLGEEGRLKLEFQPVYWKIGEEWNYQLYGGVSFQATGDLALRASF